MRYQPGFIGSQVGVEFLETDYLSAGGTELGFSSSLLNTGLIVCVQSWHGSTARTLLSATLDGGAVTIATQNGSNPGQAIFYKEYTISAPPPGPNIVATMSGSVGRSGLVVYRVFNYTNTTPYSTAEPTGGAAANRSMTITLPKNGALIAGACNVVEGDGIWTNATEDVDQSETSLRFWGASRLSAPGEALTVSHNNCRIITGATWR